MNKPKVFITRKWPESIEAKLKQLYDVVDTQALIESLKNKRIAGAGLDVYENEPNVPGELLTLNNVSLLPHLGSATLSTRIAMGEKVLSNLAAFFAGTPLPEQVI